MAALFVHTAALDTPSPPEAIAKAYKLTPMELRVLLAIVEVGGVPEVAEALGIAETTVRTHLHHDLPKDRHQSSGRPGQAGRRIFQSTAQLVPAVSRRYPPNGGGERLIKYA